MIAVIFEVLPADGRKQEYLDIAASLRPELEKLDGFISIERFASLTRRQDPSLSLFRDECRTACALGSSSRAGRAAPFLRLPHPSGKRSATTDARRAQAPQDSRREHAA